MKGLLAAAEVKRRPSIHPAAAQRRSAASRLIRIAARLACLKIEGISTVSAGVWSPSLAGPSPTSPSTSCATKLMSPAPRLSGIELAHLGEPEVAVDGVQPGQQRAIAGGRRHRRIAVLVEADRGLGAGQRLGDDRAHLRPGALDLLRADRAQVAAGHRGRGDDVGLAGRLQPDLALVQLARSARRRSGRRCRSACPRAARGGTGR